MSNTFSPLAGGHSWWPCLTEYHNSLGNEAVTTVASDYCGVGCMVD